MLLSIRITRWGWVLNMVAVVITAYEPRAVTLSRSKD